jgi:radical SAM superfamily enzyme YgiQ (UPF0313 family)
MSWPTAVAVIRQVRERRPYVPIVVGGIHPTMFDDYLLMTFPIDFIVRGEGELAIVALANALDQGHELGTIPISRGGIHRVALSGTLSLASSPTPSLGRRPSQTFSADRGSIQRSLY